MKLIKTDPKKLRDNPENPRRAPVPPGEDAMLLANVLAVGILQPPVAREVDGKLVLIAGHRRRNAAIAAKLKLIDVLIREPSDDILSGPEAGPAEGADSVRAFAENMARSGMNPVDQWQAIEAMVAGGWTQEAIATALNLTVRRVNVLRHLSHLLPAMLKQIARGDMPSEQQLRTIGLAPVEEQASVWKSHRPKRDERASWNMIANALDKRRIPFTTAKFGEAETEAFGITWEDDLFAPGDTDPRFTTQVDVFLRAQRAWLEVNIPVNGMFLEVDEWGRPMLPPRAEPIYYRKPGPDDTVGLYVDTRSGDIKETVFRKAGPVENRRTGSGASGLGDGTEPPKAPRPDLTQKGEAMVGDLRTEALHAAFAEAEISDQALIGLLVLALAGQNVSIRCGARDDLGGGQRGALAASITEGGVLTADPEALRIAARGMLRQALSCRVGYSSSGTVARIAGIAVDADAWLPTTATEEFLGNISKAAIERTAIATNVLPRNTGKATRAAIVEQMKGQTFLHPLVRFGFTEAERRQIEKARALEAEHAALRQGHSGPGEDEDEEPGEPDEAGGYEDDGESSVGDAPPPHAGTDAPVSHVG
ncbi:ParB N-terminal domain-containing protein (plasmid) [Roseomonas mucosa]|uniref:ParB N-terminal domain-containing protein n=1 Tax=Roseomonas mucosa TaxID=207340 RepID=UPI0030D32478